MKKIKNSYKKSGVNISLANKLVKHISGLTKKVVKKRKNPFDNENIGNKQNENNKITIPKIKITNAKMKNIENLNSKMKITA